MTDPRITASDPSPGRSGEPAAPAPPTAEPGLRVDYALALEDVAAFLQYEAKDSPRSRGQPKPRGWLFLVLLGLMTLIWALTKIAGNEPLVYSVADIMPVLFVVCLVFYFFWGTMLLRLQLRSFRQNPRFFERRSLEITPALIAARTESHAGSTAWHAVEWIVEHREHVFFYISKTEAYILPKRAFADERQYQEFLDTARHYHAEARRFVRPEDQA